MQKLLEIGRSEEALPNHGMFIGGESVFSLSGRRMLVENPALTCCDSLVLGGRGHQMANDTHYGLAAYVWTKDLGRAIRLSNALDAGWMQVNHGNAPTIGQSFGGNKQSGIGREFSLEGMSESFTHRKSITIRHTM